LNRRENFHQSRQDYYLQFQKKERLDRMDARYSQMIAIGWPAEKTLQHKRIGQHGLIYWQL
jgi:hypothetical protein